MDGSRRKFEDSETYTVVFGITSSPYLLGAVIDYYLKMYLEPVEDSKYSMDAIEQRRKSFYVDNCVASVQNERKLHQFMEEATSIFSEGKFDLRGWEYSDSKLVDKAESAVLRLIWNKKDDELGVKNCVYKEVEVVTRRINPFINGSTNF